MKRWASPTCINFLSLFLTASISNPVQNPTCSVSLSKLDFGSRFNSVFLFKLMFESLWGYKPSTSIFENRAHVGSSIGFCKTDIGTNRNQQNLIT